MRTLVISLLVFALVLALAITFGGPATPEPMAAINAPFKALSRSGMPPLRHYTAADGQALAYRDYGAPPQVAEGLGSVVLVHGSSASSDSMHAVAMALHQAGLRVFALDMRGHGASGQKGQVGHIDHVGQLDTDMADFMQAVQPPRPATLAGFSSGGGFVLRVAGSAQQALFDSYLLMSPFLGQDAPTYRPDSGGWVSVGLPRIAGLVVLNALHIRAFNHLEVTRFALNDEARALLTPGYDYNLANNFRPQRDYLADMRAAKQPVAILAGDADEAFRTDQLQAVVQEAGQTWPVQLLPGLGHIPLILAPEALQATVTQVRWLQRQR